MIGTSWEDPSCIHTVEELKDYIEEIGFLPLFHNSIQGFSVEEHTVAAHWWTGDAEKDPWLWRVLITQEGNIAYGKFFGKKAGFIAKKWIPVFANLRRDGYDFDSLYEDGYAKNRAKKIMDLYEQEKVISSVKLKEMAGFGKGGEKNFNGILTELQMQLYLVVKEYHKKVSKAGKEYGMDIGYYAKPEDIWGYEFVTSCYGESVEESAKRIEVCLRRHYPDAKEGDVKKVLKVY